MVKSWTVEYCQTERSAFDDPITRINNQSFDTERHAMAFIMKLKADRIWQLNWYKYTYTATEHFE